MSHRLSNCYVGTSVVAHTATITSFSPDPNDVIPQAIAFAENALKSAYKETSVKRFVLTSSSSAAVLSAPGAPGIEVLEDTWNESAVKAAWAEPPYTPERGGVVYAASKTEAEKAVWKYHKENRDRRPDLVVNAGERLNSSLDGVGLLTCLVLPNFNFGKSLDPVNQGHPSSSGLPVALWQGQVTPFHHIIVPRMYPFFHLKSAISNLYPEYFINVQDTGRLHVAAAVFDHVKDRRIFGFADRFNWDEILDILRKAAPNKEFPANFSSGSDANEIKPRAEAEKLLRDLGRPGWVSLEETVLDNVSDVRDA